MTACTGESFLSANFNSHTREGVTKTANLIPCLLRFQLTHPWGCDYDKIALLSAKQRISTHTPVRVWLTKLKKSAFLQSISTHTPVRVWHSQILKRSRGLPFQLTHPWGCDENTQEDWDKGKTFQLTHPWGCDFQNYSRLLPWHKISTHTPVRVWLTAEITTVQ